MLSRVRAPAREASRREYPDPMPDSSTSITVPGAAPIVTRFAPSPTGHLHIGGARTALFCWAFAQHRRLSGVDGRFMIRIEDTDQARSSDESARGILDDLAWLGITWDDGPALVRGGGVAVGGDSRRVGPYFQAQRTGIYNVYLEHLVRSGRAYPAFETAADLDAQRAAMAAAKKTFKYLRPADIEFGVFPAARWARAQGGEPHVLRFMMPPTEVRVQDEILGEVKFAAGEVDDFVIRKQDGFPTYHFAVVIDDELMNVTHVLRAQEHLINTPRHVALQRALTRLRDDRVAASGGDGRAFRTPIYAHMPLIFNADGGKMSKRDKAKAARRALKDTLAKAGAGAAELEAAIARDIGIEGTALRGFIDADNDSIETAALLAARLKIVLPEIEVWDYRENGYLPEAIVNFLALLGWSPGVKDAEGKDIEKFDMAFLAQHFELDRIGKTSARFDRVKLLSFNGAAIAALPPEEFERRLFAWAGEFRPEFADRLGAVAGARRAALLRLAQPRSKTLREVEGAVAFALVADDAVIYDSVLATKAGLGAGDAKRGAVEALDALLAARAGAAAIVPAEIDAWVKAHAETAGIKVGDVAQPIRFALTGASVSPPLGDVVGVLGVASARARLRRALASG
ncbi:hypothetical protein BH11PLA1_BH11PLA1_02800 [soil metagenome]